MQFIDLLLVRCIFGGQIGHNNYEDFEHPTLQGAVGASKGIVNHQYSRPTIFQRVNCISILNKVLFYSCSFRVYYSMYL